MKQHIRELADEPVRVETGTVCFGSDWPGLFVRGDDCFNYATHLQALLDGRTENALSRSVVLGLLSLLKDTRVR